MEFALIPITIIAVLFVYAIGYTLGYKKGMDFMRRIDDRIIDEAKRQIYGEE